MAPTAWLASYPKSGNTWIRAMLNALEADSEPDLHSMDLGSGHDGLGAWLGVSLSNLDAPEASQVQRRSWASADSAGKPYIRRKTHIPWSSAADGFATHWQPLGSRAIYIARDPRAVAVSWAHHNGFSHEEAVESLAGSREPGSQVRMPHLAHGRPDPGCWTAHVKSWQEQTHIPVHFLTYEQLSTQPVPSLAAIADWLGIRVDEQACARAVERCTFSRLLAREATEGFAEAASVDRVFFRRGTTDSWREELSADLAARIGNDHAVMMQELRYLN